MSITVSLPHDFVTLDELCYQIALAVLGRDEPPPDQLSDGQVNPEAIEFAGTYINWEDKTKGLYKARLLSGRNPMSKERLDMPVVNVERVKFYIEDLRQCEDLTDGLLNFSRSKSRGAVAPGLMTLAQAALALEKENGVDRGDLFDAMGKAAALRKLTIRDKGTGGVHEHEGYVIPEHTYVRAEDVNAWLEQHYRVGYRLTDATGTKKTAPPPKQRVQEERILEWLQKAGVDPLRLPKRKAGKKWIKSEVAGDLLKENSLFTSASFKKAWERLAQDRRIKETDG